LSSFERFKKFRNLVQPCIGLFEESG